MCSCIEHKPSSPSPSSSPHPLSRFSRRPPVPGTHQALSHPRAFARAVPSPGNPARLPPRPVCPHPGLRSEKHCLLFLLMPTAFGRLHYLPSPHPLSFLLSSLLSWLSSFFSTKMKALQERELFFVLPWAQGSDPVLTELLHKKSNHCYS